MMRRDARRVAVLAVSLSMLSAASSAGAQAAPPQKKAPVPAKITVTATTPDPPWTLRLENPGEHPIRVPADVRLLSLEVEPTGKAPGPKRVFKCSAPAAMRPSTFPKSRELYLKPGEAYEETFDPRLLCFGASTDALREGATVKASFGWAGGGAAGPYAAEGLHRPATSTAVRQVKAADPLVLSPAAKTEERLEHLAGRRVGPKLEREGSPEGPPSLSMGSSFVDQAAEDLDIYVERFEDAAAPRDIAVTLRAVNEGGRQLATVVRTRMLAFVVEELGPDNQPTSTVSCEGQHAPHAIPRDMVQQLRPGQEIRVPILVAEMCPRNATFLKPGLYRITVTLDARLDGEGLKVSPYLGRELARQPVLVRLATASKPFYEAPPEVAGAHPAKAKPHP